MNPELEPFSKLDKNSRGVMLDLARRKIQFHRNENWQDINLWGLADKGVISDLLKKGWITTDMINCHGPLWYRPTEETYKTYVEPLLKHVSFREIMVSDGWNESHGIYDYFDSEEHNPELAEAFKRGESALR